MYTARVVFVQHGGTISLFAIYLSISFSLSPAQVDFVQHSGNICQKVFFIVILYELL
jgi:hypothetical protein